MAARGGLPLEDTGLQQILLTEPGGSGLRSRTTKSTKHSDECGAGLEYACSAVPLYEYIAADPELGCRICRKGFELNRPLDRPALEVCPICRQPVRKRVSRVNTPSILKPLSIVDAKKAGFTVLQKRDQGTYEKL